MAEFIYKDYSCELKFGEKVYTLPLNEQTAELIEKTLAPNAVLPTLKSMDDINAFYDKGMDSLDTILGEGSADEIMSRFKHPGTMELLSVINYIVTEWETQYSAIVADMKKTANIPNRETRRNRQRQ